MRRKPGILRSIVSLTIAAAAWLLLAPAALGGSARMLTTEGGSMEPGIHEGDLALVRPGTYGVGDVVAYRSELLGSVLLHRIVDAEGGRYTLQGDANDFVDPDRPTDAHILGELFLRIPAGGRMLAIAASPVVVAAAAGLLLFLTLRRRRDGSPTEPRFTTMSGSARSGVLRLGATSSASAVAAGLVIVAFAAAGIGTAAVATPATGGSSIPVEHRGSFTYEAPARAAVYPDGVARTGDAIFLAVSKYADVTFTYALETTAVSRIEGRIALRAQLSDAAGWTRMLTLRPETPFTGTSATVTGRLRLVQLQRLLERVQRETGVVRTIYRIELLPAVELRGSVAGAEFREAFTPTLPLEYDGLVVRYVEQLDAILDPLAPVRATSVSGSGGGAAPTIRMLGRTLPARPLAAAMGILAVLAAIGGAVVAHASKHLAKAAVATRIRTRFASRIVELARPPDHTTAVVANAEGFERLATATDEPILEYADRYGVSWFLRLGDVTYSFRVDADGAGGLLTPDAEFARLVVP